MRSAYKVNNFSHLKSVTKQCPIELKRMEKMKDLRVTMEDLCSAFTYRVRSVVGSSNRNHVQYAVSADGSQASRGETPALRTVRLSTELARSNFALKIRCEVYGRSSEDTFGRRRRWFAISCQNTSRQICFRKSLPQIF